jgi:hypothetical protein
VLIKHGLIKERRSQHRDRPPQLAERRIFCGSATAAS